MDSYVQNKVLNDLTVSLVAAKNNEDLAKQFRITIENKIISAMGKLKSVGATSKTLSNFKLTVTKKVTVKIDWDMYDGLVLKNKLSKAQRFDKQKSDVDGKQYNHLKEHEPDIFKRLSPAITETPAKTAVTFKAIDNV